MIHGFYAVVDTVVSSLFRKLLDRHGPDAASEAIFRCGFDPSDPIVVSLVSDAISDMLLLIDAQPNSTLGEGLEIEFESRFRLS
ncbi:hypothetical protein M2333_003101 [Sphingobium sp. B11D3B]|nr:hypothetical protein [Sphingobium sp. B11D3B]